VLGIDGHVRGVCAAVPELSFTHTPPEAVARYEGVRRLPAGHLLCRKSTVYSVHRLPGTAVVLRFAQDDNSGALFRDMLDTAASDQRQRVKPLGCFRRGGKGFLAAVRFDFRRDVIIKQ